MKSEILKIAIIVLCSVILSLFLFEFKLSKQSFNGRYQWVRSIPGPPLFPEAFFRIDTATGEAQMFAWDDKKALLVKIGLIPSWKETKIEDRVLVVSGQELGYLYKLDKK